jgi:hypothetical protein
MERLQLAQKERKVSLLRPLWILNAIRVTLTPDVLKEIDQNLREVVYIGVDLEYKNTLDAGWGVTDMQCQRVWHDFGANGSGVVVGHKDSGTDLTHPGLVGHIWVNPGEDLNHNGIIETEERNGIDDDGNGYVDDFYGWNFNYDNNNIGDTPDASYHGTHSGSIISSGFSPCDTVSVAPGAKLMELVCWKTQGEGWEASQYAMMMGAQVISQSFSFKESECTDGGVLECPNHVAHRFACEMELAGGMLHANSTGNYGQENPLPFSAAVPSDCPPAAMLPQHPQQGGVSSMVAVGAYSTSGDWASYSGRGPCAWSRQDICYNPRMPFCGETGRGNEYPSRFNDYPYNHGAQRGLLRPDVAGPTDVPSCAYGGGCSGFGGTSAATPHVGGALALIFSKFPDITPEDAYRYLMLGAADGGAAGVDSLFGFGKIRPYSACSIGITQYGFVSGRILNTNNNPVAGVRITADSTHTISDASGSYRLAVRVGQVNVVYQKYGYADQTHQINFTGGQTVTQDITLSIAELGDLSGIVRGNGAPLSDIMVTVPEANISLVTSEAGYYSARFYVGTYTLHAGQLPWVDSAITFTLTPSGLTLDINLQRSPQALPVGPDHYGYYIYDQVDAPVSAGFNWVEINPSISGGLPGSNLFLSNDAKVTRSLPFTFPFYGTDYVQISICENGFLQMGAQDSGEWAPTPVPSLLEPNGFFAPEFFDWQSGSVFFYNQPDSHRVIVEWYNMQSQYFFGPSHATFEAILYDPASHPTSSGDGVVKYQYYRLERDFEGTIGVENQDGTDGIEYRYMKHNDPHAAPLAAGSALLVSTSPTEDVKPILAHILPEVITLKPNYPNPFNPSTTFSFMLPHAARVKLILVDLLGREAATVYDGLGAAGENQVRFSGENLASGVYFARLEAQGKKVAVQKVALLK